MSKITLSKSTVKLCNGVIMPMLGCGTYKVTGSDQVHSVLDTALEKGYRLIDTAHLYQNEADIGKALKDLLPKHGLQREDVFLTTKIQPATYDDVRALSDLALKSLETTHLDLLLIHYPRHFITGNDKDANNPHIRKESWIALERFYDKGMTRAIGVSNYEVQHLDQVFSYARVRPAVNQCEFHPHLTRKALRKHCQRNGVHFQAYTSLGRNDPSLKNEELVKKTAEKHAVSVSEVLLAWALNQGVSVLPKSSSPDRIRTNFNAGNLQLSKKEIESISALNKDKAYTICAPWNVI